MIACVAATLLGISALSDDYRKEAAELFRRIEAKYSQGGRFYEWVDESGKRSKAPAYAWDMGVTLSALAAAIRLDPNQYTPKFERAFKSLEPYGSKTLGGFGYSDLPNLEEPDRFYDDNEWIGIALMEAHASTKNSEYLKRTDEIFRWLLSAESSDLGGGLFWHEKERNTKNTCSNAPGIVMAMKLYQATQNREYLDFATRTMAWTKTLQDTDGLYLDHISLDGKVDKTKWTYNSALMIRANLEFYRVTRKTEYLSEAKRISSAAIAYWVDPKTGAIKDEASFAHHLADALLELSEFDAKGPWRSVAVRAIRYAYNDTASKSGLFGLRWDKYVTREGRHLLLYQSGMARALWRLSDSSLSSR